MIVLAFQAAAAAKPASVVAPMLRLGLGDGAFIADESSDAVPTQYALASVLISDLHDDADRLLADMFTDARARGSLMGFVAASTWRAAIAFSRGLVSAALSDARRALELAGEHDLQFNSAFAVAYVADSLLELGELEEAARMLAAYPVEEMAGTSPYAVLLSARARTRIATGRIADGIADLRTCGNVSDATGFVHPNSIRWRLPLALALPATERDEALALVELDLRLAHETKQPRAIGLALRARGLLRGGQEGLTDLEQAAATLEQNPSPLEFARALTDLGAARRRANQRAEAREPLRRGLDLAHRCGATALVERAQVELSATGARPRHLTLTGAESLTPSERRVSELAAAGMSNREIAQALYVSIKTVAAHLTHAYQKLNITARSELAETLLSNAGAPDR
jgi:DNA-binding CsgD family transcriptional regulator